MTAHDKEVLEKTRTYELTIKQAKIIKDLLDVQSQDSAIIGENDEIDYEYAKAHYECRIIFDLRVNEAKKALNDFAELRKEGVIK